MRDNLAQLVTTGAPEWTTEGVSIPAALQQALPQAQIIPAVRDADEDGRPGAKTSFGLLLKSIILPAIASSSEYQQMLEAVSALERKLKGEGTEQIPAVRQLADQISSTISSLITARVTLGMDTPDAEKFVGSNTVLRLDDGTATRISMQGHGLQRALVFAMLEILAAQKAIQAQAEGAAALTRRKLLLFEEPELFIHPHLMRRLRDNLVGISEKSDWQVIVTTHSPFLVDVATDPCSLVVHRRPNPASAPQVTQLSVDPFATAEASERERLRAALDFHPTVSEAFFAKRVVLVEGDTEMAILVRQPKLYELAGIDGAVQRDISVVSCDGKWTIIPLARLLKAFGIPLRCIHDQDRKGKTDAELAADPSHEFHANARIAAIVGTEHVYLVDDTIEDLLWDAQSRPKSSKDKPYRAWKRVRELYSEKTNLDHAPKLRELVQFAFGSD